jgi:hypothetical protein
MNGGAETEAEPTTELLTEVRVRGFRTLKDAAFWPGPLSALVGEPGTGKSNLLAAIRAALDPKAAPLTSEDVQETGTGPIRIDIETGSRAMCTLEGEPPSASLVKNGDLPPVLYLPAHLRATHILDGGISNPPEAMTAVPGLDQTREVETVGRGDSDHRPGSTEAAHGLVADINAWVETGRTGTVVLIEEPELFLPPQTQRFLYRLFRRLAAAGNQILYSTHSPSFLNVARLHELVLTEHDPSVGTRLLQPEPLHTDEEFRAYSEFDAARSELFLARAAILVEGQTERLALPFVFHALGYDPDQERISIIECGGKPNIPLIARVAAAVGVPFIAVHDRDARKERKPIQAEQRLNQLIGQIAGDHRIELTPDFEGVAGLKGHTHKPARAWRSFADLKAEDIPEPLARIATMAVTLARR